jgi:hypothetical protein
MVDHAPDAYESLVAEQMPSRPRSSRYRTGVRGGLISAAATAGAVIGFGVRNGDWAGPFSSLGYQVLAGLGAEPPFMFPTAIGVASHVAWMIVWGLVHSFLSARRTAGTAIVLAVVVSVSAAVLAREFLPAAFGAVRFAQLPGVQVVLCVALMALGLVSSRALNSDE